MINVDEDFLLYYEKVSCEPIKIHEDAGLGLD
jgi:hypothetical protein